MDSTIVILSDEEKDTITSHSHSSQEMSTDWIERALANHFGVIPTIIDSGRIEEASHGFMSSILRVSLLWPIDRNDLPSSIVLKMPGVTMANEALEATMEGMDEESREQMKKVGDTSVNAMSQLMHDTEAKTYALFRDSVAPFKMPLCYHSSLIGSDQPVILMEDIKGASINDVVDGFREKQLYSIVDEIVKIHAYSFENEQWRSIRTHKDPEMIAGYSIMLSSFSSSLTQKFPDYAEDLNMLTKHCISDPEWWIKYENTFDNRDMISVLVHGDMWSPQFLWKGDQLQSIVDWQLVHPGSLTEDLLHVLSLCIPVEMRERLTKPLLNYYYEKISELMEEKNKKVPFSKEYLEKDYMETLPVTACIGLFALSMWSNSPVLRSGTSLDHFRISEMEKRVLSIVSHCVQQCKWT
ncbi:hypothetical protein PRIPAC_70137 [Pristionchus pacificus]|nr:hypothetical protein PRIPAC_70137 [Pristionchus pacificus]